MDPACFLLFEGGLIIGIVAAHVDDLLFGGNAKAKKLLEEIKGLKHGFESFGSIKLKDKGTQRQRIGFDLNIDLDSKSDSLFSAMMEDRGKKQKQSVSEQTLQATQWIAADSLSPNKKPLNGLTPVHELYRDTYTKMAKNIIGKCAEMRALSVKFSKKT